MKSWYKSQSSRLQEIMCLMLETTKASFLFVAWNMYICVLRMHLYVKRNKRLPVNAHVVSS